MTLASYTDHRTKAVAREARARSYVYDPGREGVLKAYPEPFLRIGVFSGVGMIGSPLAGLGDTYIPPRRYKYT